jgi:glutamate N-acetyltransferase/amino-acid N-acetyltransferase
MAVIMANGVSGVRADNSKDREALAGGLFTVCSSLAEMIARDGEGATKLIKVRVSGAQDIEGAKKIARSIATSNLVKTAIFGEDANWGRIFCAAGYAGVHFAPEKVDIYLNDVQVAGSGSALPFDEGKAKAALAGDEVLITVALNQGAAEALAWTCDLTDNYIKINASYRT